MTDTTETKNENEWNDNEEAVEVEEFDGIESATVMQFSDFVGPDEKQLQSQRMTELRRRAEERQDWKQISHEYDWDFDKDDVLEEA